MVIYISYFVSLCIQVVVYISISKTATHLAFNAPTLKDVFMHIGLISVLVTISMFITALVYFKRTDVILAFGLILIYGIARESRGDDK